MHKHIYIYIRKILKLFTFSTIFLVTSPLILTSCSDNSLENSSSSEDSPPEEFLNINTDKVDQNLKKIYLDWYKSLTKADWDRNDKGEITNYYSSSEQQSIALYANWWGWFWNEPLHHQQEPKNLNIDFYYLDPGKPHEVRGVDWTFIQDALVRAVVPENIIVWHGVEYQEDEFWNQLKDYIKLNSDGTHDYSQTVGKTIESYGFISASFNKAKAYEYSDGTIFSLDSKNGQIHMPLKEKAVFEIKLRKNNKGAAYLADFDFSGTINYENQVLIKKDSKYKITGWHKEGDVNIFDVDYVDS